MRKLSLDEVKQIGLEMLIYFDKMCRENDIKYSITYGTLLGAIRHKGYIPWDDDIDVMMSREEYEKFLSIWKDSKYKLLTLKRGSDFWPLFSRITDPSTHLIPPKICNHGVWMAVIPYDKIPDDSVKCQKHMKRIKRGIRLLELKRTNIKCHNIKTFILKTIQVVLIPFSPYFIGKHIEKIKKKYRYSQCKHVNSWKDRFIIDADIFNDYIDVDFEGHKVMAIKRTDYLLRYYYNDYMQLPPENERVPRHSFTAYRDE